MNELLPNEHTDARLCEFCSKTDFLPFTNKYEKNK